jgi:V8-like Glu-specific endopeptidase
MLFGRSARGVLGRAPVAGRLLAAALLACSLLLASSPGRAAAETAAPGDPYRMIVMLQIRMPRGEVTCTGFMVGPHTVATAAHCLYNKDMGGWASSAFVTPGLDGVKAPFATVWATSFTVSPSWVQTQDLDADYAAITLPTDAIGHATGWFELASPSDFQLSRGTFQTAGYGVTAQYGTLWRMPEPQPLIHYDEDFLAYVWGTSSGESGAPIFETGADGQVRAVGLLKGAYGRSNARVEFALRMDATMIEFYRKQTALPVAAPVTQSIPTMFTAEAGASVRVTSPATRVNTETVLQASADQVRWATVAAQRTDERGVATYTITPTETRYYRVVVQGVGTGRVGRGYVATAPAEVSAFAGTPRYAATRTAFAVFLGGTTDDLARALRTAGAAAAWVQDEHGDWHVFVPGVGFLNDDFERAFPQGLGGATSMTLVAA